MADQTIPSGECEFVRNGLMGYLKGELNEAARERIEAHLSGCEACRKELEVAYRVLALTDAASEPATDRAADDLLNAAVRTGASDLHLEPQGEGMRARLRIDGKMEPHSTLAPPLDGAVLHRFKLRAGLDLTESRRPQQGRIHLTHEGVRFEVRVGTLLTQRGESMTLRFLRTSALPSPEVAGIHGLEGWVRQPNGILLVCGPAGSGKVTTAYALLQAAAGPEVKAVSVGSWVPYVMENVTQIDLMGAGGLTPLEAVRALMAHQDPDVLLVEEIRDADLAGEALEVALTGHLVLATVHARSGPAAARRLLDFGADPDSLAEALVGIVSQRLVRKVCPECAETVPGDANLLNRLGLPPETTVRRGAGCAACEGRGFKGRLALSALYDFTDGRLRRFPVNGTREALLAQVQEAEVRTLRQAGAEAVRAGQASPEEVLRVLDPDERG